jgi:hypothetical protein
MAIIVVARLRLRDHPSSMSSSLGLAEGRVRPLTGCRPRRAAGSGTSSTSAPA